MTEQMIQMTKEEFQAAMAEAMSTAIAPLKAEISQLKNDSGAPRTLRTIKERTFNARMIDGKIVVGYRNRGNDKRPLYVYWKPDPNDAKEKIYMVDIVLEGMTGRECLPMPLEDLRKESERIKCKIVDKQTTEWTINQGMTRKAGIQNDDYSHTVTDFEVPIDIVGITTIYTIEVPAGNGSDEPRRIKVPEMVNNIE